LAIWLFAAISLFSDCLFLISILSALHSFLSFCFFIFQFSQ
jgi:hypothetical protein